MDDWGTKVAEVEANIGDKKVKATIQCEWWWFSPDCRGNPGSSGSKLTVLKCKRKLTEKQLEKFGRIADRDKLWKVTEGRV